MLVVIPVVSMVLTTWDELKATLFTLGDGVERWPATCHFAEAVQ